MTDARRWRCPKCGEIKLYWEACHDIDGGMCSDCIVEKYGDALDEVPEEFKIEDEEAENEREPTPGATTTPGGTSTQ